MNKEMTGPSTLSIIIATPKPRPSKKKKKMMGGGYTKKAEMAYGGMSKVRSTCMQQVVQLLITQDYVH
jgi:hypothetical protein